MVRLPRIRTLRGRLAFFYACVSTLSLIVLASTLYGIVLAVESEDDDPTGEEQRELAQIQHRVLVALGIAVPVGLAVGIGGGAWITRKAFASLDEVVHTAKVVGADNIQERVPSFAGAGAEVEQLASALNGMLARLERATLGLRRFTANAAHELRTPLTLLLGSLELSLRRPHDAEAARTTMEEAHEELERMARLVESLLTLARSDASELAISPVPVDVAQLISQVIGLYEVVAQERGIELSLHAAAPVSVRTDPLWLSRIVVNLIDNACKFTGAGGLVEAYVEPAPDGVRVTVQDTGPGISAAEQAQIFERFFRGAGGRNARTGFGLGLSLARDLALALGGNIHLESPAAGQIGARFILRLPDYSSPNSPTVANRPC